MKSLKKNTLREIKFRAFFFSQDGWADDTEVAETDEKVKGQ